jgi:hypothetical protein
MGDLPAIQRDPLTTFMEGREQYGDVVRYRGGPYHAYLISHPERSSTSSGQQPELPQGVLVRILKPVLGLGLLTSEGESG